MNDFDKRLRALLEAEAAAVTPDGTRARSTLAGVRRRLLFRAAGAGLTACAVVMTAVVGADAALSALDRGAGQNAASAGHQGREGAYPVIAEGTFEGRDWTLSVVEDPDAAHPEDTESENPEILFEIEGSDGASFETYSGWDLLAEPFFTSLEEGGYELVMGMVADSVASVSVESDDGTPVAVLPVYDGGDRPLEDTNYYLTLFESDGMGDVVARDEDGRPLATRPLVEPPGPATSVECIPAGERPHREEERDPAAGYRDVGEGTFDGRRWTLEMIERPDIAHPEDDESSSEDPEILFEMEGPEPNAASFATHEGWDTIDAAWRGRLQDTDFAMGMAATNVASVTFEGDDGTTVEASLFDGAGLPGPEASYYVVFMPHGAKGEVVARAASGAVLGRAAVDEGWSQEIDFDC